MKFENTQVFNFEGAFRGLRNPLDSWSKSDSHNCNELNCCHCEFDSNKDHCKFYKFNGKINNPNVFVIGKKDMDLAQRMIKAKNPNDKFLRQIFVSFDIIPPRYWLSEADTYTVGVSKNSCSTMHTIHKEPFNIEMFEDATKKKIATPYLFKIIDMLEELRQQYLKTKDFDYVIAIKTILPEGFLQRRTVTLTYENIRKMIRERSPHRLPQWRIDFINWCHKLPYADELLFYCNGDDNDK